MKDKDPKHQTIGAEMIATRFQTGGDKLPTFTPEQEWIESLSKEEKKQIFKQAKI